MKNMKEQTAQLNRDAAAIAAIHTNMQAELAAADTVTISPEGYAKLRRTAGNTPVDADTLLADAQQAQANFWDALKDLEAELELEIDGTEDLSNHTVDSLTEEFGTN